MASNAGRARGRPREGHFWLLLESRPNLRRMGRGLARIRRMNADRSELIRENPRLISENPRPILIPPVGELPMEPARGVCAMSANSAMSAKSFWRTGTVSVLSAFC